MRKYRLLILLLLLCLSLAGCYEGLGKKEIIALALNSGEALERAIQDGKVEEWEGKQGVRGVTMHEDGFMEFFCAGAGMGSGTCYYGFYYSPQGEPYDFWGRNEPLTQTETGWEWREAGGDNYFITERISDKFFYYEYGF